MKANRTGANNAPPQIENLGDGSFYYNFNVRKSQLPNENEGENDTNWDYDQVRCSFPLNKQNLQNAVNSDGYDHTVKLNENE